MDPQHMLVRMYLFACRRYQGQVRAAAQRQSNNDDPDFTDEEVLGPTKKCWRFTFLAWPKVRFGVAEGKRTVSGIYRYVSNHFSEWFPELPTSCNGFRVRLNRMSTVFAPLAGEALSEIDHPAQREEALRIVDSMPIMIRCRL